MARRRASRLAASILAVAAVAAVGIYFVKHSGSTDPIGPLQANEAGPALAAPAATPTQATLTQTPSAPVAPANDPSVPKLNVPTTLPADAPSNAPAATVDAEQLFKQATIKRDGGDLVAARDMVNNALQAGQLTGSDVDDAKAFIGALNDKIILGTGKFSADPFNKLWKVEPGTALAKLCKRFDVTAELLCKVNGLESPHKLRAGATIKTIQGPFHLVVSKSRFEADVYLGAPGGAGSMYIKTLRVGLGSDGSTPLGTWQVDSGKIVNPVYYSPRGEGVIAADDPKNPLGERWIPLKGIAGDAVGQESYGIHGTIEPDSIGKNMSLGCIRLLHDDIVLLYDLLVEGKSQVKVVE